jgi:DNA-binding MarR family transcriptional regulator
MIDKSSNATRIVDKLVLKKFVDRTQDPNDRRHVDIKINKKGLELLDKIDADLESINKKFKDFNQEKAKIMNEWLDELRS